MAKISDTKPTLNDIKADLAARVEAYVLRTEDYFGTANLNDLDVYQSPIGRDIPVYYEYAFEARMPAGCDIENWGNEDGFKKLEDFIVGPSEGRGSQASGQVHDMIKLVKARRALDNGDRLSIKQISLLAGMTEKSVRNAMYTSEGSRLEGTTDKTDLWFENHEAKSWLKGRRGFRETTFATFDDQQPERLSHAEISKFIHDRVHTLYGGSDDGEEYPDIAVAKLGWKDDASRFYKIFENTSAIRPEDCEALANLIKVDAAWFTEQVMRALFPRQMELAIKSASKNERQSINGANGESAS